MKDSLKKYFISILALLLILSNFSFAASYMYCKMTKSSSACICENEIKDKSEGISIDEKENSCCQKEFKVLSNSTNQLSYSSEIQKDITLNFIITILPEHSALSKIQFLKYNHNNNGATPPDIVITTSSLLI